MNTSALCAGIKQENIPTTVDRYLYAVHSTRYTIHNTQYTLHSSQFTVHNTQYTLHSTQYTWSIPSGEPVPHRRYTAHTTQLVLSTQCTVHSIQYTVHSTLSLLIPASHTHLYIVHRPQYSNIGVFYWSF